MSTAHDLGSLKERIARVLTEEVAPALQMDGAALEVLDVGDGVVRLRLGGACAGCPSTLMTLIHGLEQELRRRMPQIEYLEAVP
jgi:Fe-S cluster biogenesis protein NfuA